MLHLSLIGNLAADAELRYSQKGNPVVGFRVGVNQTRVNLDGARQQSTEWFQVRVMGHRNDFAQRLTRGTRVLVLGRLDISHYHSREGEQRVAYDVWADEVQNLSPRQTGAEAGEGVDLLSIDSGEELPF